jgi:hypothetical protein
MKFRPSPCAISTGRLGPGPEPVGAGKSPTRSRSGRSPFSVLEDPSRSPGHTRLGPRVHAFGDAVHGLSNGFGIMPRDVLALYDLLAGAQRCALRVSLRAAYRGLFVSFRVGLCLCNPLIGLRKSLCGRATPRRRHQGRAACPQARRPTRHLDGASKVLVGGVPVSQVVAEMAIIYAQAA